jgi:hypothetical protein
VHRFSMATLGGFELMIFPTSPCTSLLIRSGTAGDFSRLAEIWQRSSASEV